MPGALDHKLAYQKTLHLADLQEIKLLCRLHARARDGRQNVASRKRERKGRKIFTFPSRSYQQRAGNFPRRGLGQGGQIQGMFESPFYRFPTQTVHTALSWKKPFEGSVVKGLSW